MAVVERWFAAVNQRDVDTLCALADPAIRVTPLAGSESLPPGTTYHGRDGVRTLLTTIFERFPRLRLVHGPPQANGNKVTVDLEFWLDDGVTPPKVRALRCDYRVADGRIRRITAFDHNGDARVPAARNGARGLSRREREILSLLAAGRTVVEIARELVLSPLTVRTHVRNAKDKLKARTTTHAVAIALDENALDV